MSEARIIVNSNQDTFGQNGLLPDKEYDIHCHAISGGKHIYKLNYYKSSCAIRLEEKTCLNPGECPRYSGPAPTKRVYVSQEHNKKPRQEYADRVRICVDCGKKEWIRARGLCKKCYNKNRNNKTLDNFKKIRVKGATVSK